MNNKHIRSYINSNIGNLNLNNYVINPDLIKTYEYINWIYAITSINNKKITDDLNDYDETLLSVRDKNCIPKLHDFYTSLLDYFNKNNLPIYRKDFCNYILISYQNEGFEIGTYNGQGAYTYARKVQIEKINDFVSFESIVQSDNIVRTKM